jgi:hypothetical protein
LGPHYFCSVPTLHACYTDFHEPYVSSSAGFVYLDLLKSCNITNALFLVLCKGHLLMGMIIIMLIVIVGTFLSPCLMF